MESNLNLPNVRSYQDCVANDGKKAIVIGKYMALSKPVKGIAKVDSEKNYAAIVISDGTYVFLEPMDSPQAIRARTELDALNNKWVEVFGTINFIMPSSGQSLINPCVSPVISIHEHESKA